MTPPPPPPPEHEPGGGRMLILIAVFVVTALAGIIWTTLPQRGTPASDLRGLPPPAQADTHGAATKPDSVAPAPTGLAPR